MFLFVITQTWGILTEILKGNISLVHLNLLPEPTNVDLLRTSPLLPVADWTPLNLWQYM